MFENKTYTYTFYQKNKTTHAREWTVYTSVSECIMPQLGGCVIYVVKYKQVKNVQIVLPIICDTFRGHV